MSPLAIKNSGNLDIDQFDMKSAFFTDSIFFNRITIKDSLSVFLEKILAAVMIVFLLPIFLITFIFIRLSMGKGVFFKQERVGKNGSLFIIYKFRTMINDAESLTGAILSSKNDPRVTSLGKILRASHVDELPQLINVLNGDMSFVGPRPERPEFVDQFQNEIEGYQSRHDVRPGITGLAQICLPYDATAKEKLQYDKYYINNRQSVLFNLIISCYTGLKMITFFRS